MRRAERKCCTARISVGAISAAWQPFSMAMTAACRATMVFPLPTSPCNSRFMGAGFSRSAAISANTRVWHARIEGLQRRINGAANRTRTKRADGFVDRHDAADLGGVDFLTGSGFIRGVRGGGVIDAAEQLDLRIHHLEARGAHFVDFCFPVQHQELALLKPAFEIAAVKEFAGE